MNKLTKKEEIIVKTLVKKFSKDNLDRFIYDYIEDNHIPSSLKDMIRMIKVDDSFQSEVSIQYLQYAYQYYENIVNGDFSNDIERVKSYALTKETTESEIVYKDYTVNFYSTPSLLERKSDNIKDNFWNYDFDSDTIDYGDSEVIEEKYNEPRENRYSDKNIIK